MTHSAVTQEGGPDVLGAFEDAWRRTPQPDLAAFLPSGQGRTQALIDLVHVDMEMRARSGLPFHVEAYTSRFPELAGPHLLDLVAWEHSLRSRGGAVVPVQEYARRFPSLAGTLEKRLNAGGAPWLPTLPGYEIDSVLGQGGMGEVYGGRHLGLARPVAVKLIRRTFAEHPQARRRFEAEGRAVARLDHPCVVRVFDCGTHEGQPYLVMERVDGGNLSQAMGRPMPPRLAAGIVAQLADAAHHAHERGVVHRDIKPGNVLLWFPDGADRTLTAARLKLTDFGLARLGEAGGDTRPGEFLGTVAYAAPEQVRGEIARIGPATDVYALGAVLFEMLTGRPPFTGEPASVLNDVLHTPPRTPHADPALDAIVLKALSKRPEDRHASARELSLALKTWLRTAPADPPETTMPTLAPRAPSAPSAGTLVPTRSTAPFNPAPPPAPPARPWALALGLLAAALALAGVVLWFSTTSDVRVSVDLPVDAKDARLAFILDGRELPREEAEGPIRLKPGKHTLVVKRDGKPWKEYAVVVEGRKATVEETTPAEEKPAGKVTERQLAEWVLEQGGHLHLEVGGAAGHPIFKKDGLPDDPKVRNVFFMGRTGLEDDGLKKHLAAAKNLVHFAIIDCPLVTDDGVAGLRDLPSLDTVVFQNCKRLTDEAVRKLPMDRLTRLSLQGIGFTSASVKELARAKRLVSVGFIGMRLSDDDFKAWADKDALIEFSVIRHPAPADFTGAALAHLAKSRRMNYIDLSGTGVSDGSLKHLEAFPALAMLRLDGTPLSGKGFGHLVKLPSLTELRLAGTVLEDEAMKRLAECPRLTTISLEGATVSEAGFAALGKSRSLWWLGILRTGFGDKAAAGLAECPTLAKLDANGTQLGDEGAAALSQSKSLRNLTANETKLTDKGVIALAKAPALHTLSLWEMALTDESAKALAKSLSLRQLGMASTGLTDKGLEALERKKGWEALNIQDTKVTAAGVERFRKAHPRCAVGANPPGMPADKAGRMKAAALHALGGQMELRMADGKTVNIAPGGELPDGELSVSSLRFTNNKVITGPALRDALAGLPQMGELSLSQCPELGDEWAAALPGGDGLRLTISGANKMSDGVFLGLAGKKIRKLSVNGGPFTPACFKHVGKLVSLSELEIEGLPFDDEDVKNLAGLAGLTVLRLRSSRAKELLGDGLAHLATLAKLERLYLQHTLIDDRALKHIGALKGLQTLDLSLSRVTGKGFGELANLPALSLLKIDLLPLLDAPSLGQLAACKTLRAVTAGGEKLDDAGVGGLALSASIIALELDGSRRVTDKGAVALAGMKQLSRVSLRQTSVGDAGAAALAKSPLLESLTLDRTPVTDKGARALAEAAGLRELSLMGTTVTDEAAKALAASRRLRRLDLSGTAVTDEALKALQENPLLESLNVRDTKATKAGVAAFTRAKPRCSLEANPMG